MNVLLSHIDFGPLLYGLIMWLGLAVMLIKFLRGSYTSLMVDVIVFSLVFCLHGGSMAGGFAAMICALIAGFTFPYITRAFTRKSTS